MEDFYVDGDFNPKRVDWLGVEVFDYPDIVPFGRDFKLVDQIGAVDLRYSFQTGIVPADLEGSEPNSNGIDNPSSIVGRPDDVFAMHRAAAYYSSSSASSEVSPEGGESA